MKIVRALLVMLLFFVGCETPLGPNELGGNADLELTREGNEFGISLDADIPVLANVKDSVVITKNDKGIITVFTRLAIDERSLKAIDSSLGLNVLTSPLKQQIIDYYKDKFGLVIDSTNKDSMYVQTNLKFKVTSDGIQEFVTSRGDLSKPYTIMKYNAKVGDRYEFVGPDGIKRTRTVIQTHQDEDWQLAFWMIKTMRVEQETPDDPLVSKIIYIGNHKFGFVGMIITLRNGKTLTVTILPWSVM